MQNRNTLMSISLLVALLGCGEDEKKDQRRNVLTRVDATLCAALCQRFEAETEDCSRGASSCEDSCMTDLETTPCPKNMRALLTCAGSPPWMCKDDSPLPDFSLCVAEATAVAGCTVDDDAAASDASVPTGDAAVPASDAAVSTSDAAVSTRDAAVSTSDAAAPMRDAAVPTSDAAAPASGASPSFGINVTQNDGGAPTCAPATIDVCSACAASVCCSQASACGPECKAFTRCTGACETAACGRACLTQFPEGVAQFRTFSECVQQSSCKAVCSG